MWKVQSGVFIIVHDEATVGVIEDGGRRCSGKIDEVLAGIYMHSRGGGGIVFYDSPFYLRAVAATRKVIPKIIRSVRHQYQYHTLIRIQAYLDPRA